MLQLQQIFGLTFLITRNLTFRKISLYILDALYGTKKYRIIPLFKKLQNKHFKI